ncbi:MAG: Gfo/Idh/MocA family oxidoreductase [Chthonomonadales bacterium]
MMILSALVLVAATVSVSKPIQAAPLRVGIAGLVHGHVGGFLNNALRRKDIEIVGIAEPNTAVAERYQKQYKLPASLFYSSYSEMMDKSKPEAVLAYTNTFDHKEIVEECAARKIHVMMEKPLAISNAHGKAIAEAGKRSGIHILVNYETTWYPNNGLIQKLAIDGKTLGKIRKVTVRDGHQGPKEINVQAEFLDWLTDAKRNGAGALYDFGCYGANLTTWLMNNERPISVMALTQTFKPEIYKSVDDDAIIVLEYPGAQATIMASWNWPYGRKDWEIYGEHGSIITTGSGPIKYRIRQSAEETITPDQPSPTNGDPISYLIAVIRGNLKPTGTSSLENNLIVTEILDAARTSAKTGKRVMLPH